MRRSRVGSIGKGLLAAAVAALVVWLIRPHTGPAEGSAVKPLDLPWISGENGRLQNRDLAGSVTVIEAFAGWCSVCKHATPELNNSANKPRKQPTKILGISLDTDLDEARATAHKWNLSFPVALADEKFRREYQINVLPTVIVVDQKGIVRHARAGKIDTTTLEDWLTELGAGLE